MRQKTTARSIVVAISGTPGAGKTTLHGYKHYPLIREYYLAVVAGARRDCDLIVDGTKPTAELTREIVDALQARISSY